MQPTDSCYEAIKDRLWVGAYPGNKEEKQHKEIVTSILDAGINTFVCLQTPEELKRFRSYQSLLPKTCEWFNWPIVDRKTASDKQMMKWCSTLYAWIQKDSQKKIYLHCWGGKGRSATMLCLLLSRLHTTWTVEQVIQEKDRLQSQRRHLGRHNYGLTAKQLAQLKRLIVPPSKKQSKIPFHPQSKLISRPT